MVCKLFSSSSSSLGSPFEIARHLFRFGNVFRLGCLYTTRQQNINSRSGSRVINPIPSSDVNTHFGNTFADGLATPKFPKVALNRRSRSEERRVGKAGRSRH